MFGVRDSEALFLTQAAHERAALLLRTIADLITNGRIYSDQIEFLAGKVGSTPAIEDARAAILQFSGVAIDGTRIINRTINLYKVNGTKSSAVPSNLGVTLDQWLQAYWVDTDEAGQTVAAIDQARVDCDVVVKAAIEDSWQIRIDRGDPVAPIDPGMLVPETRITDGDFSAIPDIVNALDTVTSNGVNILKTIGAGYMQYAAGFGFGIGAIVGLAGLAFLGWLYITSPRRGRA
ncbi:MAG: hypothetical protein ACREJD_05820 [Phycisphaerales bacterium]